MTALPLVIYAQLGRRGHWTLWTAENGASRTVGNRHLTFRSDVISIDGTSDSLQR